MLRRGSVRGLVSLGRPLSLLDGLPLFDGLPLLDTLALLTSLILLTRRLSLLLLGLLSSFGSGSFLSQLPLLLGLLISLLLLTNSLLPLLLNLLLTGASINRTSRTEWARLGVRCKGRRSQVSRFRHGPLLQVEPGPNGRSGGGSRI